MRVSRALKCLGVLFIGPGLWSGIGYVPGSWVFLNHSAICEEIGAFFQILSKLLPAQILSTWAVWVL